MKYTSRAFLMLVFLLLDFDLIGFAFRPRPDGHRHRRMDMDMDIGDTRYICDINMHQPYHTHANININPDARYQYANIQNQMPDTRHQSVLFLSVLVLRASRVFVFIYIIYPCAK